MGGWPKRRDGRLTGTQLTIGFVEEPGRLQPHREGIKMTIIGLATLLGVGFIGARAIIDRLPSDGPRRFDAGTRELN
jgi:hypothetical protein